MEEQIDLLEPLEAMRIVRRQLLPWWIKIFCWVFMVFGVLALGCLGLGLFGYTADLALYGVETDEPLAWTGLLIIVILGFKAVTAFALWFEKDYAIVLGKMDALIGIGLCLAHMIVLPFFIENFHVTIRLELVLLIPYLIKLNKIQDDWTQKWHIHAT